MSVALLKRIYPPLFKRYGGDKPGARGGAAESAARHECLDSAATQQGAGGMSSLQLAGAYHNRLTMWTDI